MKRRDLAGKLKKNGWYITNGNPHDKAKHPDRPDIRLTIPKHRELDEYTARSILKQAGIE